jgi:hypothetical protein
MRFNLLYARSSHLRVALAVGLLLTSCLAQSCTPRAGSTPSPGHPTADAPAPADAALPQAPHARPVVIACRSDI